MDYKEIPLTRGKVTTVDAIDFEWLSQFKWTYTNAGYAVRNLNYKIVLMHRIIMQPSVGFSIDHVNGNRLDNRRENLRLCTHRQNIRNQKNRTNAFSKYKGVGFNKVLKKWRAYIGLYGKYIHLGYFINEIDAAKAYNSAALEHFGEFARLNII